MCLIYDIWGIQIWQSTIYFEAVIKNLLLTESYF